MSNNRVACARAIETTAEGKAPHAVRLWRAGINETDKGPVDFTPKSAALVMEAYEKRGCPLVFDYEHETLLPLEQRGGAPMKGVASAPSSVLEIRNDESGAPECWASSIGWTVEAQRQIESGERRQISPVSDVNKKTREVTAIINVALCIEGATHQGTLLASAAKGKATSVEDSELIQKVCEAAAAMDWATVIKLAQDATGVESAPPMAAAPPPAQPAAPMAASRAVAQMPEAYARAMADLAKATVESKRATVEMQIATSRECFDAVDEKEHLFAADPAATRKHIASIKRKVETSTVAASRAGAVETGAKPPKDGAVIDEAYGLDATDIQAATRMNVTLKDYAASKARNAPAGKGN